MTERPLPIPDQDTRPYWEAARRHELLIQRCRACGQHYFYPRPYCPQCLSPETEWVRASGRGTVYSFTVNHRAAHPAFADRLPYVVALIDLAEGPRMMSTIVECDPADVHIGMAVEVTFEDVTDEISLPVFRPARRS
jgi:uncharacterized OB-fold protein